jgi:hypothetical protein
MPPIPDDACIIADYMLMADFVANSTSQSDLRGYISKGVRFLSATRDHLHDMPGGSAPDVSPSATIASFGLLTRGRDLTSVSGPAITYFGEAQALSRFYHTSDSAREYDLFFNGTAATSGTNSIGSGSFSGGVISGIADGTGRQDQWINAALSSGTLGTNTYHIKADDTDADDWFYVAGTEIITPIHTSHHYKTFETPFLHELIGGDRNMEQTHLICSADGKTWDDLSRDKSYVPRTSGYAVSIKSTTGGFQSTTIKPDAFRGKGANHGAIDYWMKDFVNGYDRIICLKEGLYHLTYVLFSKNNNAQMYSFININEATVSATGRVATVATTTTTPTIRSSGILDVTAYLKRGDYVCCTADSGTIIHGGSDPHCLLQANRVG